MDLRQDIEGKDVLVVEGEFCLDSSPDIVDTGYTMKYLLGLLGERKPASLKVAVLCQKEGSLKVRPAIS